MAQRLLGYRSWLPGSPLVVSSLALKNLLREKEACGMAVTHNFICCWGGLGDFTALIRQVKLVRCQSAAPRGITSTMSLMHSFDDRLQELHVGIYGFGPWFVHSQEDQLLKHNWEPIVFDWLNFFNPAINNLVTERATVIQAGGWQGVYPFLLSNMFERVYTFEPDPMNFHALTKNCQRKNIYKFQAVLSDSPGIVTVDLTLGAGQNRVVHDRHPLYTDLTITESIQVPAITIDSLNVPSLSYLMLDVENYENQVIDGAIATIEKFKPVVCVEKSFIKENDVSIEQKLTPFGYKRVLESTTNMFFKVA